MLVEGLNTVTLEIEAVSEIQAGDLIQAAGGFCFKFTVGLLFCRL